MSTPMRRMRPPCCARAASGHAAAPPRSLIVSRRFIRSPRLRAAVSMGHGKPERLGGLEVHRHLEFCRKLHREITRLGAAKNAIDISGGTTIGVYRVNSVGEQAAVSDNERISIDRRDVVASRRQYDRRAMHQREHIRHDDKAASRLA